jgi:hypothetical protein
MDPGACHWHQKLQSRGRRSDIRVITIPLTIKILKTCEK